MGVKNYIANTPQALVGNVRGAVQGIGKGGIKNALQNGVSRFGNELSSIGRDINMMR